ncbi:hypothetical protein BDB00DRAFT_827461 [Zychaea mexicana]|uniref:uncharacterized protein n=1 Tax=Zychaea mexicana TaxID=64656 RepID=UPI0022FE5A0C|nr:uncharacterized protein BDB00DRAFT_827461 [Zychaea mexicana]KAI9492635.1 hypothetical protein BDB00DRAFT_827461 [Zychaea mexicana]
MDVFAQQFFNAGIIVISYVNSVIGALTTLELLTQRTHYKGAYNWLLLLAAAISMGGVGIWSMHFIGNNCLTITIAAENDSSRTYQLAYGAGYTFASLVVAIFCMFVSFAFVGVTEEAKLIRIVPSGILAGSGIALMHYIGQFAVKYFIARYKVAYVAGAVIIAIAAVTVALYIFFKLREQWANQWYKRLGCAMLMGVAVCGMHYTAMAGTEYMIPSDTAVAPVPSLSIAALVGIISAVVIVGCAILLYALVFRQRGQLSLKTAISASVQTEKVQRRLVLNSVVFDNKGKILVKVDGVLPKRTVMDDMSTHIVGPFSTSQPLFFRLFEATTQWTRHPNIESYNDPILQQYLEAAQQLAEELKLSSVADLGILFDSVLHAQAPAYKHKPRNRFFPVSIRRSPSATIRLLSRKQPSSSRPGTPSSNGGQNTHHTSMQMLFEQQPQSPSPLSDQQSRQQQELDLELGGIASSAASQLQVEDEKQTNNILGDVSAAEGYDSDDEHILLVRKIGNDKELAVKLLSQGFRFADPVFIARIMGAKLNLSAEHMLSYFKDMRAMVESTHMAMPISAKGSLESSNSNNNNNNNPPGSPSQQSPSSSVSSTRSLSMPFSNRQLEGGVYVGLLALVEEKHHHPRHHQQPAAAAASIDLMSAAGGGGSGNLEILVDKNRHFSFPVVPLRYEDGQHAIQLGREEKSCVHNLQGQSMLAVSMLDSQLPHETSSQDSGQSTSPILQHHRHNNNSSNNSSSKSNTTNNNISASSSSNNFAAVTSSLFSPATIMAGIGAPSQAQQNAQIRRFVKALGTACKSLVQTSNYGKLLGTGARLHGEVLEIPPFTIIPGPCELILFRTLVTIPGTNTAINQTPTEPIKCIPLKLFKSFAYHVTDQAIELYRQTNSVTAASIASRSSPQNRSSSRKKFPQLVENGTTTLVETFAGRRNNSNSGKNRSSPSLTSSSNSSTRVQATAVELPIMVNLMPTQARFLWLDLMVEETLQANKSHRR